MQKQNQERNVNGQYEEEGFRRGSIDTLEKTGEDDIGKPKTSEEASVESAIRDQKLNVGQVGDTFPPDDKQPEDESLEELEALSIARNANLPDLVDDEYVEDNVNKNSRVGTLRSQEDTDNFDENDEEVKKEEVIDQDSIIEEGDTIGDDITSEDILGDDILDEEYDDDDADY